MQSLTMNELGDFIQMVSNGFAAPLFYGFTAMIGFAVLHGVKKLVIE